MGEAGARDHQWSEQRGGGRGEKKRHKPKAAKTEACKPKRQCPGEGQTSPRVIIPPCTPCTHTNKGATGQIPNLTPPVSLGRETI